LGRKSRASNQQKALAATEMPIDEQSG